MRKIIFIIVLVLPVILNGQQDIIQKDSLIIINQFDYDLNYGISMFHRFCPNQKTLNKEGKLLREIKYVEGDKSEYEIDEIIYFYYDENNRVIVKEAYNINAELQHLIAIDYNEISGDTLSIKTGTIINNKFNLESETRYKYKNQQLTNVSKYKGGKKSSKISITYTENRELREEKFTKKAQKTNNLKAIFTEITKEEDKIVSLKEKHLKLDLRSDSTKLEYTYNESGLIKEVKVFKNDSLIKRNELAYYPDAFIKSKSIFNWENKKIGFTTYEIKKLIRIFGGIDSAYLKLK